MSDSILERLQADIAAAMKARDAATLSTLRMLKSALMEAKTRKPRDAALSDEESVEVLQRYVKKRREAIDELRRLDRTETIPREEQEIEITLRYLPRMLPEEDLRAIVQETIASSGATGPREMGKVIGAVMAKVKGRAEGGTVSRLVREALGS